MGRRGRDKPLVERILSADRPAVLVCGPAACGKTTAALEAYRRYIDRAGRPACILLVPNAPTARRLCGRLLDSAATGVLVSPQVLTFAGLAGRVLSAAGDPARAMSPFQRRCLLSRIVRDLCREGRLTQLAAVADTPGLVVALDRAIAELKRAAVEPEDLARAVGDRRDKRGDLVEVYRRYQEHLRESAAYDVEGMAWLARNHLRAAVESGSALPGLEAVQAVVADGFTDFTPTQLEILGLLAGRLERVIITLPHAEDGRDRLWHWTGRTLDRIRRRMGDRLRHIQAAPDADDRGLAEGLRSLWDSVFRIDAEAALPPSLRVVAAPGIDAEVAAAARRIKALLVAGAPAGSIAVLARSLEPYREPIRRIFAEHHIPVAPAPEPLTDVPVVRFLLQAASLPPRWAWRDCLAVIRNSYFRPRALGDYSAATVAAAERLIRQGNVVEGRAAYAKAAERLASALERRREPADADSADDDDDRPPARRGDPAAIRQAAEMLERLFSVAAAAGSPEGLLELARALDLRTAATASGQPETIARDLRALAVLADQLRAAAQPAPELPELRAALSAVACPPARGEALVDVLDVLDARPIRYDHVFLLGASQRQFPPKLSQGALIGEADRAEWAGRGLALDSRSDLTAREMLLFYLAVSRAAKSLTISYLEADASGQVGAASVFLQSLLSPCGGIDSAPVERIPPGQFLPAPEDLASPRDTFNAAVAGLFQPDPAPWAGALSWVVARQLDRLRRAAMGLWARSRRWLPGDCDDFDGRITDPDVRRSLAEAYGEQAVFSPAALNAYGQCPWAYFATHVLRLAEPVEPIRRVEPLAQGTFCHNVLCRLMRSLSARAGGAVVPGRIDQTELGEALDEAVAAEAAAGPPSPYPVLWRIQQDRMRQDIWEYLLALREGAGGPDQRECLHFELSFGQDAAGLPEVGTDPASRPEPAIIATPAGQVRLRGRIDRVDRIRAGQIDGLLVVDYKTGRLPSGRDVLEGRNVQLPLYALAAEGILGARSLGGAFHKIGPREGGFERLFAAVRASRGGNGGLSPDDGFPAAMEAVLATVGRFVDAIRSGRFDALPTRDCPGYCPFRRICQYSPARARLKGARAPTEAGEEPEP